MRFARIEFLYAALGIVPLLGLFLWWSWRQRQRLITQFVQSRLLAVLTVGVSRRRQQLRLWLVGLGVAVILVALARPQWGFGYQEVKQRGLDIIIALDTSRSMLAEDVAPNRLARAKLAALDLRRLSRSDRMGLVAFAGSAFLQMPMSVDEDVFRQHLESLDTSTLPQGGTAIAEAIQTARNAFKVGGGEAHRALVLFTDGEDHDSAAVDAAREAAKDGLHIFTIGVGTPGGELLRIRDAKGRTEFIKDENGNAVKSRLNEGLLQEIAQAGGGFYLQLSGAGAMEMLQERGLAPLPKMDLQATVMRQYFERFQWFLGLALLLLLAEMLIPDRKPPVRVATGSAMRIAASRATLLAAALMALPLCLASRPAGASPSSAQRDYDAGRFKNALGEYQRLLEQKPNDAPLRYNAGAAAYQAGKFETAVEHFSSALATPDPTLQEQAYYNRGNSRFRFGQEAGEPQKTQELWKQAIADYETALKLKPDDRDAAHNLDIVKKRLEELQQQQQQQQNQDQKGDDSKDKKDDKQQKQDSKSKDDKDKNSKDGQQKDQDQKQNKKDDDKSKQDSQDKDGADQQQQQQQQQEKNGSQGEKKDGAQAGDDKEKEKKPAAQETARQDKGDGKDGGEPQGAVQPMQMTRKQAIQLLEALRSEERLLTMPPPRTNRTQRTFKDW